MGMADFAQDLKLQANRKCKLVFSWVSQVPNFTVSSMRNTNTAQDENGCMHY